MPAVQGIRSIDFLITATGEGVVNNNGNATVFNPGAGQTVNNHQFPKLRGVDPTRRLVGATLGAEGTPGQRYFSLGDASLDDARLVVSAETVRHHLFRNASFGITHVTPKNIKDVLASLHGLMRGYLMTGDSLSIARPSPLFLTALECEKPGLYFNQGSRSFAKDENSLFSYFGTAKDLLYEGMGSISVEGLRFIPLENSLLRSAYMPTITVAEGKELATGVTRFLHDLAGGDGSKAAAEFVEYATRIGSLSIAQGEAGLLLNDEALDLLIDETLAMLRDLYIRQGKGYVRVTDLKVDFNDSARVLRLHEDPTTPLSSRNGTPYLPYYTRKPPPSALEERMAVLRGELDSVAKTRTERKAASERRKAERKATAGKTAADNATGSASADLSI